jgi:hypothetical protein
MVKIVTAPKSNKNLVGKGKIDTPYRQIHENLLFWLGTGTLKSGAVNIVVWAKHSLK